MVIDFTKLDLHDRPTLILKNAGDTPLGVIGQATNVELEGNYNEISVLTFDVPSKVDGEAVPYYDDVIGMRVVSMPNIGQFTLISPEQHDDGVIRYKRCKAYSLEYEFSYKKITLAKDTYKFWGDAFSDQSKTVLGMIMELMPSWHVSSVSASLLNKYRTFEVNNENLYNFIKNTVQQSFGCIFDFDTINRSVSVRDVTLEATEQPVYLSTQNLVKEIVIHEDVENMVTRLDVNGADGVDIRDVNPTGTNKIINLDYYMNTKNFSQALINKYNAWKQLVHNQRNSYYANSISYTLAIMKLATARAKLADLEGELLNIDNQRGVIIQAISKGIATQSNLDNLNTQFNNKAREVENAETEISQLETAQANALQVLKNIVTQCSFEGYFTSEERSQLDRYIRDGEITESSFVSTTSVFNDDGVGANLSSARFTISNAKIETITQGSNTIYDVRGGTLTVGSEVSANIISGVLNYSSSSGVIFTASLGSGTLSSDSIIGGSVTINAPTSRVNSSSTSSLSINSLTGYMYFSVNPSEYQRRSVAWELYEYGELLAEKLSQPTYTFSIESANFLAIDEFEEFKNHLRLGQKLYLDNGGQTLKPICIGFQCDFNDLSKLTLKFGDSYVQSDTSFKLVDILEKSVSMGRTVDAGKFCYEEFSDTGVRTSVRKFMTEAIDVSKNKILSSKDQAISWDTAGLRLRKWANENQTAYEDEQIWMNNNSVLMTDDNWQTAKMAIGKILKPGANPQSGEYLWGLIAEMIVGRMIAGESLIIESAKTDGSGVSVFRVDGDGCRIENGDLSLIGAQETVRDVIVTTATNMYSSPSSSSSVVTSLKVNSRLTVMNNIANSPSNNYYYCVDTDGHRGWVYQGYYRQYQTSVGRKHIVIHPDVGIVIGKYPVVSKDQSGHYTINTDNAKMWIDSLGNVYMSGTVNATSLHIKGTSITNIDERVSNIDGRVTDLDGQVTDLDEDITGIGDRVTTVELRTTDNAIINTVTETQGGKEKIGSLIEQKADSIRMKADKISWESQYSTMQENGTLTVQRAIIDGALSAVHKNDNGVRDGMLIGQAQIIGVRNGNNIFNISMPFANDMPINSYVDDSGTAYSGIGVIEAQVPEVEIELGDDMPTTNYTSYQPPNSNSDSVTIASVKTPYNLRLGAGGIASLILDYRGNVWICPPTNRNVYIRDHKTLTRRISCGLNTLDVVNGLIVDSSITNCEGITQDWEFDVVIGEGLTQHVTMHINKGLITGFKTEESG